MLKYIVVFAGASLLAISLPCKAQETTAISLRSPLKK